MQIFDDFRHIVQIANDNVDEEAQLSSTPVISINNQNIKYIPNRQFLYTTNTYMSEIQYYLCEIICAYALFNGLFCTVIFSL